MVQYKDTNYFVDEFGNVYGFGKKLLKPRKRGNYLCVFLYESNIGKNVSIHRMIAETFVPNPSKKEQVNHKDGNKLNNISSNLEWVTKSENQLHAYSLGLQKQKRKISIDTILQEYKNGLNGNQISKKYSVDRKGIYIIINKYK